jgi:hypothetical protein
VIDLSYLLPRERAQRYRMWAQQAELAGLDAPSAVRENLQLIAAQWRKLADRIEGAGARGGDCRRDGLNAGERGTD